MGEMKRMNRKAMLYNVTEAREELENIERAFHRGTSLSEGRLQVMFEHAYHHLNFAWNIRHTTMKRYRSLSDQDFNRWSSHPKKIEEYKVD